MQNALIYSAGFDGHRQVYVFVLADILKELGFNIFIVGDTMVKIIDSSYLDKIKTDNRIKLIDASSFCKIALEITLIEFVDLQERLSIDLTVFADADHHISLFVSQIQNKSNKLKGKTVGIFLRPFYFHKKLNILNKLKYIKRLKDHWKNDDRLFHEILLKQFSLLDTACYIDEKFVSKRNFRKWLPDVFQQYAESIIKNENLSERIWIERLNGFKAQNKGRFIILYFGTAQQRRGYDILLKLAIEQNACFVHCGLNNTINEKYEYNVEELKMILREDDRIFETNQYIKDPVCIKYFFECTTHLILPYRNFLGSSGVMLQALEYGIPVLVPDEGILGFRVKEFNLGLTFEMRVSSLDEQFKQFIEIPKEYYAESIKNYMKFQSITQLEIALFGLFNNSNPEIKIPKKV